MSIVTEYRNTEAAIKELQERLQNLSNDGRLQQELEFENKLRTLMNEYQMSLPQLVGILDPEARREAISQPTKRTRERKVKIYKNPHTGEVVETKGGNHKTLKEWKTEFGADVVESWVE